MKIKKSILIILFCILYPIIMEGQENKSETLSLEDLIPGGLSFSKYKVQFPQQMQWWGDVLVYLEENEVKGIRGNQAHGEVLFDKSLIEGYSADVNEKLEFPYADRPVVKLTRKNQILFYDFEKKEKLDEFILADNSSNQDFSKEAQAVAYTRDNNLFIQNLRGNEIEITSDEDQGIVNGQAVHRNEFGIHKGTFWSPKGNYLAFYRMDETMVSDYPLVDVSARVAKLKNIKYPMAGMASHEVTVGVYDLSSRKTVFLKTGLPKDKYLTNVAWSPNEDYIYIAELNRGQDTCQLIRYNAHSGERDLVLFSETHPKYVEPENPIVFLKDGKQFIWQSRRDGYNHIYLYDTDGKLVKQLTSGDWDVTAFLGFDEDFDNLFYISAEGSPLNKTLYKINIKSGKRSKISIADGVHMARLSPRGHFLLDIYSSKNNAGTASIINIGKHKETVFFQSENPYKNFTMPEITLGSVKADDNQTDLYYRMVKPINFDPKIKYPVIVYVYGGPHSQLVDNSWLGQARGWDIYMAEKGYIIFTLDNRGTANRGLAFENITHRQLGVVETRDQMSGVQYLKSLPYVDTERIGVHGWSFGGFMTLNLMLRHPETFKVGVAGGPVTDWKYYEIMYGERYMDSPSENPEGYDETSMIRRAGDLKGRLMIIHGDEDPTVVMQHSLLFLKSAIKQGTHPDFFVYPGHQHNMVGHDRVHLHEHITRYFEDFLK